MCGRKNVLPLQWDCSTNPQNLPLADASKMRGFLDNEPSKNTVTVGGMQKEQ